MRTLGTYLTKAGADTALAHEVSRMARGVWHDPRLGDQQIGEWTGPSRRRARHHERFIRRLIAEGQLNAVKVGACVIRIRRADLEDLLRPARAFPASAGGEGAKSTATGADSSSGRSVPIRPEVARLVVRT